jgi:hypothetical protein
VHLQLDTDTSVAAPAHSAAVAPQDTSGKFVGELLQAQEKACMQMCPTEKSGCRKGAAVQRACWGEAHGLFISTGSAAMLRSSSHRCLAGAMSGSFGSSAQSRWLPACKARANATSAAALSASAGRLHRGTPQYLQDAHGHQSQCFQPLQEYTICWQCTIPERDGSADR